MGKRSSSDGGREANGRASGRAGARKAGQKGSSKRQRRPAQEEEQGDGAVTDASLEALERKATGAADAGAEVPPTEQLAAIADLMDTLANMLKGNAVTDPLARCLQALHRAFVFWKPFVRRYSKAEATGLSKLNKWLGKQYGEHIKHLLALVAGGQETHGLELQILALRSLMSFVVAEGQALSDHRDDFAFPNTLFERIVAALVNRKHDQEDVLTEFNETYMVHDDVRHYTLKNLAQLLQPDALVASKGQSPEDFEVQRQGFLTNVYMILNDVEPGNEPNRFFLSSTGGPEPREDHPLRRATTHTRSFSECWLTFLRHKLPGDIFKSVLLRLHSDIIPHLGDPRLLLDFLTDSYNLGGAVSIMALHGLFTLIHQYHLDYPNFFPKLYILFDESIFHVKYRVRFFRLANLFLTSTALPAYLVAAFAKRLSRLALKAPPGGAIVIVQMIYNLLRRHPACKSLIHRANIGDEDDESGDSEERSGDESDGESDTQRGLDPFDPDEQDPAKCRALESSVWELELLRKHYHPTVAKRPGDLEAPALQKLEKDVEKAAELSYSSLFEGCPEVRDDVAIGFERPTALFGASDAFGDVWES
eukprot:m.190838 g.190838  ORF g.190838 m.190838 type:complete len:592 (+) comp18241_c0_seq2:138-1913(+)